MLCKLKRRFLRGAPGEQRFYPLSPTCQIPKLSLIYEQYFGRREEGTFVEVGAFDGEYVSNTSGLADIGWRGIYLEPVPDFCEKCRGRHASNHNVSVINTAVGDREGTLTIHVGGPLSTASNDMKANFSQLSWAQDSFRHEKACTVRMTTLETVLRDNAVTPGFELLVIDVEGYEWNVLQRFDIAYWRPQMVVIELHDQNDDYFDIREECKSIVHYFDGADYKVIWKDFTNTIYVPHGRFPLLIDER